jgi:hypothetical protein
VYPRTPRGGFVPGRFASIVVPGTYTWFIDGLNSGPIALASNNTFTSNLGHDSSGNWVQGGSTVAWNFTGGEAVGGGCLYVGKGDTAGTAVGTAVKPAAGSARIRVERDLLHDPGTGRRERTALAG